MMNATWKIPYCLYPRYSDVILLDVVKDFAHEIISKLVVDSIYVPGW